MESSPKRSGGFDICHSPSDWRAWKRRHKKPGHYYNCDKKLIISGYFQSHSCHTTNSALVSLLNEFIYCGNALSYMPITQWCTIFQPSNIFMYLSTFSPNLSFEIIHEDCEIFNHYLTVISKIPVLFRCHGTASYRVYILDQVILLGNFWLCGCLLISFYLTCQ